VPTAGKCAAPAATPHVCKRGDVADCQAQCDKGNGESCTILGRYYRDELVPKDEVRARHTLERACALESYDGCASYGAMLFYGQGGPKDEKRALSLFELACDRGAPRGCCNLALTMDPGVRVYDNGFARAVPERVAPAVLSMFVRRSARR
jgi:TPR repeat protein